MRFKQQYVVGLVAVLAIASVSCTRGDGLNVSEAWVQPTLPGQTVGAAYMQLRSERNVSLVKVESDVSPTVQIHQMSVDRNNIMTMRQLEELELPAGDVVKLEPGGRHLMLLELQRQLKAGDTVSLTLTLGLGQGRYRQERVVAKVGRPSTTERGK